MFKYGSSLTFTNTESWGLVKHPVLSSIEFRTISSELVILILINSFELIKNPDESITKDELLINIL